jgi:hypothetical protein
MKLPGKKAIVIDGDEKEREQDDDDDHVTMIFNGGAPEHFTPVVHGHTINFQEADGSYASFTYQTPEELEAWLASRRASKS